MGGAGVIGKKQSKRQMLKFISQHIPSNTDDRISETVGLAAIQALSLAIDLAESTVLW